MLVWCGLEVRIRSRFSWQLGPHSHEPCSIDSVWQAMHGMVVMVRLAEQQGSERNVDQARAEG